LQFLPSIQDALIPIQSTIANPTIKVGHAAVNQVPLLNFGIKGNGNVLVACNSHDKKLIPCEIVISLKCAPVEFEIELQVALTQFFRNAH